MHHDAIIIGGSFAGLSAALYLARARRSVCVVDAGAPRNRFAAHAHGVFALDGTAPATILATAREQVAAYPTARLLAGTASRAERRAEGFAVTLASGETLEGARLILAFGISDELPDIPGLAGRWGASVLHCPYCHGFEFADRRLGVLGVSPMSAHQAMLIAEWGPTTLYLNGGPAPDAAELDGLARRGVAIEPARIAALHGEGTDLSALELADGRVSDLAALYLAPRTRLNSTIAGELGCAIEEGAFGPVIPTDAMRMTTVSDIYAAGDITRAAHNATWASSDGVTAAVAVHRSLVF